MLRLNHLVIQTLVLISSLVGCGSPGDSSSTTSHLSLAEGSAASSVDVLYWDNMNLGFGHVAIEIRNAATDDDLTYISYAMGNDYEVDREKHGKDPVRVQLSVPSEEQFQKFLTWYGESPYSNPMSASYGSDYDLLRHNCAHAALNVLRALGYTLPIKAERPFALRPVQVYRAAKAIEPS